MKESVALLYEGLYELSELAEEAKKSKPFLYEGTGYSSTQIIMLEAEDEESFLKRTSTAIDKVKKAAQAGLKELDKLQTAVSSTVPPMLNSSDAIVAAMGDLRKKMPGDGLLGKLGSLTGGAWNALFGEKDDPVEAVTQIVADGLQFKTMLGNVVKSVIAILDNIEPAAVVEDAAEDAAEDAGEASAEISDEEKKKYIDDIKQLLMNGSINDILTSDEGMYPEIREATGFSESDITAALKKSIKPSKWFSGLKSVGASLGIGLGGDLPFKKYGLTNAGVIEDITMVKISDLQTLSGAIQPSSGDSKVASELESGVEQISDLENQKKVLDNQEKEAETTSADQPPTDAATPDTADPVEDQPGEQDLATTKYIRILKSVPGLKDPDAAGEKLAALLAADVSAGRLLTLRSLIVEKVLRYDDVVVALEDHLPEDESEIPAVIKKLTDEMKVELGNEFDIVGGPDVTQEELNAIRKELETLRDLVRNIPEEEREAALDAISSELGDDFNVSQDIVDDLVDPDADVGDALGEIPADDLDVAVDNIMQGLPPSWEEWLNTTLDAEELEDEVATAEDEKLDEPDKNKKAKRDPGTFWKLDKEQSKGEKFGAKGQGPKTKKVRYFRTQGGAEKYSLKTEKIAIAKMRGYILNESNNFRKTSFLTRDEVVSEFYRIGGTNELLVREMKKNPSIVETDKHWLRIAGLKNE